MPQEKKRPSKKAKAAAKAIAESKLLAVKAANEATSGAEFEIKRGLAPHLDRHQTAAG